MAGSSCSEAVLDPESTRLLHQTIIAVREDYTALRFNTAIARIIELTAHASRLAAVPRALAEPLVLMVAPLAPHVAEELWQRLGHSGSLQDRQRRPASGTAGCRIPSAAGLAFSHGRR